MDTNTTRAGGRGQQRHGADTYTMRPQVSLVTISMHIVPLLLCVYTVARKSIKAVPAAVAGVRLLPSPAPLSPQKRDQLDHVVQQQRAAGDQGNAADDHAGGFDAGGRCCARGSEAGEHISFEKESLECSCKRIFQRVTTGISSAAASSEPRPVHPQEHQTCISHNYNANAIERRPLPPAYYHQHVLNQQQQHATATHRKGPQKLISSSKCAMA
jgi:hypothetical protein